MRLAQLTRSESSLLITMPDNLQTPIAIDASDASALDEALAAKYARLQAILHEMESVLVAYCGGVDSALLLKVATETLGARAVGALAASPAYDADETAQAVAVAARMGARLEVVETHELDDPRYTANNADRCYFCKVELFNHLEPVARRLGLAHIAYGMKPRRPRRLAAWSARGPRARCALPAG